MAAAITMKKKTLLVGVVLLLAVSGAVVVRGAEEAGGDAAVDTQPDKAVATQEPESQASPAASTPPPQASAGKDVSIVDQLLAQSLSTNEALDKQVSRSNIYKYGGYGAAGAAGAGVLGLLFHQLYHAKQGRSGVAQTGKGTAAGISLLGLTLLGVGGLVGTMLLKKRADDKAKAHARELLGQRQVLLSKLNQLEDEKLEEVLGKAEEIGNLADDLGLYAPDIVDAVAPPPQAAAAA